MPSVVFVMELNSIEYIREWYFTERVAMIKECYRVVDLLNGYNS